MSEHQPSAERLNKVLALELGVSRREADELIADGRVTLNGVTAELGSRILPDDTLAVNENEISRGTEYSYLLFHKPVGYVCSRRQQGEHDTIYSLIPKEYHPLKPVGRLDKDSSGLLILTNDGDFAYRMTHPKFHKKKQYEVTLDRELEPLHQQMISDYGVLLEDGASKLQLERLTEKNRSEWKVLMHEGRNRQIRRTFASLGYTVTALHRTHFGNYSLGDISSGTYISTKIS